MNKPDLADLFSNLRISNNEIKCKREIIHHFTYVPKTKRGKELIMKGSYPGEIGVLIGFFNCKREDVYPNFHLMIESFRWDKINGTLSFKIIEKI